MKKLILLISVSILMSSCAFVMLIGSDSNKFSIEEQIDNKADIQKYSDTTNVKPIKIK